MNQPQDLPTLLGDSPAFLEAMERLSRLAEVDRPLLIVGERGTGKEPAARRVHALSQRWDGPLVTVNCAALSGELLDSELFGHEAGAFTGAARRRQGRFELADGGTVFLDELATAPAAVQEKLLRVLEYGRFPRVGGERDITVDVRVIAATNEDLPALVRAGGFRADLLDRLAFDVVTLPPLRARGGDIAVLSTGFGRRMAVELGWDRFPGFGPEAADALSHYHWPGNVRELRNVVERAVLAHGDPLTPIQTVVLDPFDSPYRLAGRKTMPVPAAETPDDPQPDMPTPGPVSSASLSWPIDLKARLADQEAELVQAALLAHQHNRRRAAEALGLRYDQLRSILRRQEL